MTTPKPEPTPAQQAAIATYKQTMRASIAAWKAAIKPHFDTYFAAKAPLLQRRDQAIAEITLMEAEIKRISGERDVLTRPHDTVAGQAQQDAQKALSIAGISHLDVNLNEV